MVESLIVGREESQEALRDPRGDCDTDDSTREGEEEAFREQLSCKPPAARA